MILDDEFLDVHNESMNHVNPQFFLAQKTCSLQVRLPEPPSTAGSTADRQATRAGGAAEAAFEIPFRPDCSYMKQDFIQIKMRIRPISQYLPSKNLVFSSTI